MICGYNNIQDYCLNKFSYQYTDNSKTSVIRTDKNTGENITINSNTNLYIEPCDSNDIVEVISYWECYQIYITSNSTTVASLESQTIDKNNNNLARYDNNLQDGISITVDNSNTIVLDGSIENQIHLGNVICLANILYNENVNNIMPYILDKNNTAYYLNYNTLKDILIQYFKKVSNCKNIKDDLVYQIASVNSSENLFDKYYCENKISENIIQKNIEIDISNHREILPLDICDPPCDPINGQECVNGVCVDIQPTGNVLRVAAKTCGVEFALFGIGKDEIIATMAAIAEDYRRRGFYYTKLIYTTTDFNMLPSGLSGDALPCGCAEATIENDRVILEVYCNGTIDIYDYINSDTLFTTWSSSECRYKSSPWAVPKCNT